MPARRHESRSLIRPARSARPLLPERAPSPHFLQALPPPPSYDWKPCPEGKWRRRLHPVPAPRLGPALHWGDEAKRGTRRGPERRGRRPSAWRGSKVGLKARTRGGDAKGTGRGRWRGEGDTVYLRGGGGAPREETPPPKCAGLQLSLANLRAWPSSCGMMGDGVQGGGPAEEGQGVQGGVVPRGEPFWSPRHDLCVWGGGFRCSPFLLSPLGISWWSPILCL